MRHVFTFFFVLAFLARLQAQTPTSLTFTHSGTIETWTVPAGVTSLTVEARGAQGSAPDARRDPAGKGAVLVARVDVSPGQSLSILVGGSGNGGAGGGGSFVVAPGSPGNPKPLVIAGGGGGAFTSTASNESRHGQLGPSGGAGINSNGIGGVGGSNGNGGSAGGSTNEVGFTYLGGSGGGGLLGDGEDIGLSVPGGKSFIHGGEGGGGFGGGGTYSSGGGGGGGYAGGGGGGPTGGVGGGGGSFNSGTILFARTGATDGNSGNGLVTITYATYSIRYVKQGGTGNGDGTSWTNASSDLQSQIDAEGVRQVWVAGGRYTTTNNDSFSLKNGVAVYGGFLGNETSLRPAVSPVTGQPSSTSLTSNRGSVLSNSNLDNTALLDGVVITDGSNILQQGGGVYNYRSSPVLTNCVISGNSTRGFGGGIYNDSSSPVLTNCVISNNTASQGGGLYNADGSPLLTNCVISGNSATGDGGGVYADGNSSYVLTNCLISGNSVTSEGGGIYNFSSGNPRLIGCTLTANTSPSGAAINNNSIPFILTNTILWNNQNQNAIVNYAQGVVEANNSLIESGETDYTGTGNLIATTSPFVSTTDFQLTACSVAIDAGNNSANSTLTDLVGNSRLVRRIDIGAYEFQGTPNYPVAITQQPASGSSVCVGSNVTAMVSVTGTSPTYQWYKDGQLLTGQSSATLTLINVQLASAGSYSAVVTGSCNSVTSTAFSLTVNAPPAVNLTNDGPLSCVKTSVRLTTTGGTTGATYLYSPGAQSSSATSTTATVSQAGPYSVTVTANGCSAVASTTVTGNTVAPSATLINNGPIADNNQTVTLTATGGTTYAFSPGATQQGSGNTATVTTPGVYSVTATGANGCTGVASTTVAGAQNPATICRNGTAVIRVTATGSPVKYEWYKNSLNSPRLAEITNLQRGTATSSLTLTNQQVTANYYVRVTDATGSAVVYGPFKVTVNMGCITALGRLAAEEVELKVTLMGNPLMGEQLRATVSGAAGKALNVQLLDLSGRSIHSQQWQQAEADQPVEWNLGGKASGVYLLQATTPADGSNSAQRHSVKVIKP